MTTILPGLDGAITALDNAIVIAIVGLRLKVVTDPNFLSTKLIPFFSALAQSRFTGLLKQLAYVLIRLLQYITYISIRLMKGSGIGSLLRSAFNLIPQFVQQRILSIGHWLPNYADFSQRVGYLTFLVMFPSSPPGLANALHSLADHMSYAAEQSRRNAILRDILDRYEDVHLSNKPCSTLGDILDRYKNVLLSNKPCSTLRDILNRYKDVHLSNKPCSTRFLGSDRKAEVQLVSTSVDFLHSLIAAIGEPNKNNVHLIEEKPMSIEQPAKSMFWLDKPAYRHWMIDIPDRPMAWHLIRNPEGANITIEHKESVQELTTAAMGVNLTNIQKRPLGSTYVSNLFLHQVMEIEERRRRTTRQGVYDPVDNNCQSLWKNGMLDLLICSCDPTVYEESYGEGEEIRRDGPRIPSSITETLMHNNWIIAYVGLVISLVKAAGTRDIIPLGFWRPWLWPSTFACTSTGLGTCVRFNRVLMLLSKSNKRAFYFLCALTLLHILIGIPYRSGMAPSPLEWVDIGIGIAIITWIKRIRRNILSVKPVQPAMCWSSFFSQLYEMSENGQVSRTQLENDIEAFLHTELYV